MRGPSGEIRYGYQVAAHLGPWECSPKNEQTMSFSAAIKDVDDYWIAQDPLDLTIRVGRTCWSWEGITVVRDGTAKVFVDLPGKPKITPA